METLGLNNRVLKTLSQSSAKAAVDILGMRLSTTIKDKFVEIMITETEAYGRKNTDKMALFNTYKNIDFFSWGDGEVFSKRSNTNYKVL